MVIKFIDFQVSVLFFIDNNVHLPQIKKIKQKEYSDSMGKHFVIKNTRRHPNRKKGTCVA